jgi:hypothetical protein
MSRPYDILDTDDTVSSALDSTPHKASPDLSAPFTTPLSEAEEQRMAPDMKAPTASVPTLSESKKAATTSRPTEPPTLHDLRDDCKLWYRLHVFIYDLRAFRSSSASSSRLENVIAPDYIGLPYFTDEEAERLRSTIIDVLTGDTLGLRLDTFFKSKLEKRMKTCMEETGDYRVCAAHDLAPIFERAFRVSPGDLAKNKGFRSLVTKGGLEALDQGEVWKGLGKRWV